MNGICYETKGIPVDIDFNYSKDKFEFVDKLKTDLGTTGDSAIEYVMKNRE